MIPITISIFGGKGVPRGRALLLATLYVAGHRGDVRNARHCVRAGRQGVRLVPGQPVGDRAAGAVLRADGGVDVRRVRARAAVAAAGAAQPRRRPQRRRRVPDGPRRRAHRRAVHRAAPGRHPGVRRDHAQRGHGLLLAGDVRRRHRRARSGPSPGSRCGCRSRAPGWRRSRACSASRLLVAALYYLKNVVPALAHFTGPNADVPGDRGGAGRWSAAGSAPSTSRSTTAGKRRCGRAPASRWP